MGVDMSNFDNVDLSRYLNSDVLDGKILGIDSASNLKERLGSRVEKLRFATRDDKPSRQGNLVNTVVNEMQFKRMDNPMCRVNDVIVGVARLDWGGSKPLSVRRLYNIFQCMENINTANIQKMTDASYSSCKRYARACKLILPYLEEILLVDDEDDPIVPEDSMVVGDRI